MKVTRSNKQTGFTLLEMMLVMVILGIFTIMSIKYAQQKTQQRRIDLTVMQMQQILNAALAYYVNNSVWPGKAGDTQTDNSPIYCLQGQQKDGGGTNMGQNNTCNSAQTRYLNYATVPVTSAMVTNQSSNAAYFGYWDNSMANLFQVELQLELGDATSVIATSIAARLPMAVAVISNAQPIDTTSKNACTGSQSSCWVIAAVNIPPQTLNTARAVNFSNLYRHGGCVPVPQCPVGMAPQIFVAPVSVSGLSDHTGVKIYPITSFTAFAMGPGSSAPPPCTGDLMTSTQCMETSGGSVLSSGNYWRVCLQIVAENGPVNWHSANLWWGGKVSVLAFTRCGAGNEPVGSDFTVYTH